MDSNGNEFDTVVTDGPGFVRITVRGAFSWTRVDGLLVRIHAESEARCIRAVLVDATAIPVVLTTTDRYTMGVAASARLDARVRVALLGAPVTIDGFGELVARNRGANVRVFTDEARAVEWLLQSTAPVPPR
jgi:hypothetical protein